MTPTGFSESIPTLRLAWDATMLSQYMKCPLTYYWKYVLGWRDDGSDAMSWGSLWHEAVVAYEEARHGGASREEALNTALRFTTSRAGELGIAVDPEAASDNKRSVRTLIRALVWYDAQNAESAALRPIDQETAAFEVRFMLPLDVQAPTGEPYIICGTFDGVVRDTTDANWVLERKTTTNAIGRGYWQKYDPCMQTYLYDWAAEQLFPSLNIRGTIVEGLQTGVNFCRIERHQIARTRAMRAHWQKVMAYWINRASQDAMNDSWEIAMNPECVSYGSRFKDIQKRDARVWPAMLSADMEQRELWNPLR